MEETCFEYVELMNAVLDGQAGPAQAQALEAHLEVCPSCAALYRDLTALTEGADGLTVAAPEGFSHRVMAAVKAAPTPIQSNRNRWRWRSTAALAAVCAVALLGAGSLRYFQNGAADTSAAMPETAAFIQDTVTGAMDTTADTTADTAVTTDTAPDAAITTDTDATAAQTTEAAVDTAEPIAETGDQGAAMFSRSMPGGGAAKEPAPEDALAEDTEAEAHTIAQEPLDGAMMVSAPIPLSPENALNLVIDRVYGDSGYAMEVSPGETEALSVTVRLVDGETLIDEGNILYTGLSPNGQYYCFSWTWEGQSLEDGELFRYAVPVSGGETLWRGATLEEMEAFRQALEE